MKKIKLTESDLTTIIKKVINEQEPPSHPAKDAMEFVDELTTLYTNDKTGFFKNQYPSLIQFQRAMFNIYKVFHKDNVDYDRIAAKSKQLEKISLPSAEEINEYLENPEIKRTWYEKLKETFSL